MGEKQGDWLLAMRFVATNLEGAFVIELERKEDSRGFFARSFCQRELESHGLSLNVAQSNVAFTRNRGTLRGLHYQAPPATEAKLIRCTRGSVFDVIVDLRSESPTYLKHFGLELSAENHRALFVPALFAHGYQTLANESEVTYLVSEFYNPDYERGLRYDDPSLAISWPLPVDEISDKDKAWPLIRTDRAVALKES